MFLQPPQTARSRFRRFLRLSPAWSTPLNSPRSGPSTPPARFSPPCLYRSPKTHTRARFSATGIAFIVGASPAVLLRRLQRPHAHPRLLMVHLQQGGAGDLLPRDQGCGAPCSRRSRTRAGTADLSCSKIVTANAGAAPCPGPPRRSAGTAQTCPAPEQWPWRQRCTGQPP